MVSGTRVEFGDRCQPLMKQASEDRQQSKKNKQPKIENKVTKYVIFLLIRAAQKNPALVYLWKKIELIRTSVKNIYIDKEIFAMTYR